jgi:methylenetetrahydrofolate dehydrogenase (NADP+) / methenyltetrahydrofolate cyclohydrolase
VRTTGARAVVVGRSADIAVPLAELLSASGNRVTLIDSGAANFGSVAREAEILASAAERPRFITGAYVRPGAAVVDAGYNRTETGVIGDVDVESVEQVAGTIVPMPGGIGPATIASLLERTWEAAR